MDGLLTNKEIRHAGYYLSRVGSPHSNKTELMRLGNSDRLIANASQTKTLKAVAEWLEKQLHEDDQKGFGEWMLIDDNDMLGLKEGKMPGE
ncbi:hypothetical protein LCGC14_0316410 [marine sediment metagenome]|uniref:Uncharacterized protein n=1 Tax=marine sediment metagenome TaxID=412755 RepID=A0A0F9TQU7_9ZZZZ